MEMVVVILGCSWGCWHNYLDGSTVVSQGIWRWMQLREDGYMVSFTRMKIEEHFQGNEDIGVERRKYNDIRRRG